MRVALVGSGVIGAGWAGRLVEHGHDVAIYDPDPDAPRRTAAVLANARRSWAKLTQAPRPAPGRVRWASSVADAVDGAGLVQESAPEREGMKQALLAEIDLHAPAEALVGSSTSGLLPSRLQAGMTRHPERFLVAHPFNPVYLLPLVELCAGARTDPATIDRAAALFASVGMRPLRIRKEIDGFVADRLLEALWREALWLVHDDVATTAEVDDAVRYGAGLRWAMMGTFLTYRIAGGEEGMRHFMAQFGPALKWPWTKLTDVPELTDALVDKVAAQSDEQAGGLAVQELERRRDDGLVAILQALKTQGMAGGEVLAAHEARLYDAQGNDAHGNDAHGGTGPTGGPADPSLPLPVLRAVVRPEWVDYNNHMTEARYLQVFGDATDAFLSRVGMDAGYRARAGSFFTVETHIRHLAEARLSDPIQVTTQVLAAEGKRLHLFHRLTGRLTGRLTEGGAGPDGTLLATGEHMLVHVDGTTRTSSPPQDPVRGRVADQARAHAALPRPQGAGRHVGQARG